MNDEAVNRTAPATPGLLKNDRKMPFAHLKFAHFRWVQIYQFK